MWSDNNNHVLCSLLCHSLAHHDIKSSRQGDVCKNPTANNAQPTKPVVHTCCILKPHVHSHGSSGETYLFNLSIAERDFEDLGILRIERFWGLRDLKDSEILRIESCGKDFPTCGFVPCYLLDCTWWAYFVHCIFPVLQQLFLSHGVCTLNSGVHHRGLKTINVLTCNQFEGTVDIVHCAVYVYRVKGVISAHEGIRGRELFHNRRLRGVVCAVGNLVGIWRLELELMRKVRWRQVQKLHSEGNCDWGGRGSKKGKKWRTMLTGSTKWQILRGRKVRDS